MLATAVRDLLRQEPWISTPLLSVTLDSRALNALLRAGYSALGDLADLTCEEFLRLWGVGRRTLWKLRDGVNWALRHPSDAGSRSAHEALPATGGTSGPRTANEPHDHRESAAQPARHGQEFVFPATVRELLRQAPWKSMSIRRVGLDGRAANALLREGHSTLGELVDLTVGGFLASWSVGRGTLARLRSGVEEFVKQPLESPQDLTDDRLLPPAVRGVLAGPEWPCRREAARRDAESWYGSAVSLRQLVEQSHPDLIAQVGPALSTVSWSDSRYGDPRYGLPGQRGRTLADLLEQLAVDPQEAADYVRWLAGRLERLRDDTAHPRPLLLDLAELLAPAERSSAIFGSRWGWDGRGRKTLEEVGQEFGLTRERVRQVCEKVRRSQLDGRAHYLPTVTELRRLIEAEGGALLAEDMAELALARGLIQSSSDLHALASLTELGLLPEATLFVHRDPWAFAIDETRLRDVVGRRALIQRGIRRGLGRRGAVAVAEVVDTCRRDGQDVSTDDVLAEAATFGDVEVRRWDRLPVATR